MASFLINSYLWSLFILCCVLLLLGVSLFPLPRVLEPPPLREPGELSGPQVVSLLSLSASVSAALVGMLCWGLLMVRPWRWLQTQHWSMTALLGSLISLIEIISTSSLMWVVYIFFILAITRPPSDPASSVFVLLPLGSLGLGIVTLAVVAVTSKGLVFFGGIAAGMGFALLARRIFS